MFLDVTSPSIHTTSLWIPSSKSQSASPLDRLQWIMLRLRMYNLQVEYMWAKSILLAEILSRLIQPGTEPAILDSMQASHKFQRLHQRTWNHSTRRQQLTQGWQLHECIIHGWPYCMQDLVDTIELYCCFRDELKGNRFVVPSDLLTEILPASIIHGHQVLTPTLRRARCTVYWPHLQDNVRAMIQSCCECQIHANKKQCTAHRQTSASRPMEILCIDLMEFTGWSALISVD